MARRHGRGKKNKRGALYAPLSFIIVCVALIFAMSVFFRVSKIEVEGTDKYTDEEVIEASGIEVGDNLFLVNRFTATSKIFSRLPYVEDVTIKRYLPNRLVLEIYEGAALSYLNIDNELWMMSRSCKLLGTATVTEASGLIRVTGLTGHSPVTGERLKADEAEQSRVDFLAAILNEISARDMQRDVKMIDMSNISSPSFDYLDRFTVRLGKNESIDYKFELLLSAVSQLSAGDRGTIELSMDKRVSFSPE